MRPLRAKGGSEAVRVIRKIAFALSLVAIVLVVLPIAIVQEFIEAAKNRHRFTPDYTMADVMDEPWGDC